MYTCVSVVLTVLDIHIGALYGHRFVACLCIVYVFGTYISQNHAHSMDILALINSMLILSLSAYERMSEGCLQSPW